MTWKTKETLKENPTSFKYTRYGEAEIGGEREGMQNKMWKSLKITYVSRN